MSLYFFSTHVSMDPILDPVFPVVIFVRVLVLLEQKFVSTTLRCTLLPFHELYDWRGCASFISDFLTLELLDCPTEVVRATSAASTLKLSLSTQKCPYLASVNNHTCTLCTHICT